MSAPEATARLPHCLAYALHRKSSFCLPLHTSLATVQGPGSELPGKNAVTKLLSRIQNFPGGSWSPTMGFPWELLCWGMNSQSDPGSGTPLGGGAWRTHPNSQAQFPPLSTRANNTSPKCPLGVLTNIMSMATFLYSEEQ